jgi:hypothetical protein
MSVLSLLGWIGARASAVTSRPRAPATTALGSNDPEDFAAMVNDERREDDYGARERDTGNIGPREPESDDDDFVEIDTDNKFQVDSSETEIVIRLTPLGAITRKDAYLLAAWLVVHADAVEDGTTEASFAQTLAAVLGSTGHRVG